MLVINRNTYGLEEYRKCRNIEINPTQFFALEMLQSGNEVHYEELIKWIRKRMTTDFFRTKKEYNITPNALYMQLHRLKDIGIEVEYKKDHYRLKEKEVWYV